MAFKLSEKGMWEPDAPQFELGTAFCAGEWNQGSGAGHRFISAMRSELTLAEKAKNLKVAGVDYIEFHDTEAPADQAEQIMKIITGEGLSVGMATANLFKRPEFVSCNFGHPDSKVRAAAVEYTKAYIRVAIETFKALVYVYWDGSNGVTEPLDNDYVAIYKRTADCLSEIVAWMLKEFGPERAILICIEAKKNEPPGWGVPCDAGEAMAIISMMPAEHQPFVKLNIETAHSQMGGKRYAMELGLAAAGNKLGYIHLNGGSGDPKFDEDRAFGDIQFDVAVETVFTLEQIGYKGLVTFDVQPLPTDRNDQQCESVARSVRNFRRAMVCTKRINPVELQEYQLRQDKAAIADLFARVVSGVD